MAKKKIGANVFLPMPVALVGANVGGRANFMAAGWQTRVNFEPPMVAVSLDAGSPHLQGHRRERDLQPVLPVP